MIEWKLYKKDLEFVHYLQENIFFSLMIDVHKAIRFLIENNDKEYYLKNLEEKQYD